MHITVFIVSSSLYKKLLSVTTVLVLIFISTVYEFSLQHMLTLFKVLHLTTVHKKHSVPKRVIVILLLFFFLLLLDLLNHFVLPLSSKAHSPAYVLVSVATTLGQLFIYFNKNQGQDGKKEISWDFILYRRKEQMFNYLSLRRRSVLEVVSLCFSILSTWSVYWWNL